MGKKFDFFISFSTKDKDKVKKIIDVVENVYEAKCWFQLKDSKAEYLKEILDGIENSKSFIVFISENSANSSWVLNEINHALEVRDSNANYDILPIFLDGYEDDFKLPVYKEIRFLLGRFNSLFFNDTVTIDTLIFNIFSQTGFKPKNEKLQKSLYHSSEIEAKRLESQNRMLISLSKDAFDKYVKSNFNILDIGVANGNDIFMKLSGLEYSSLLGVDIDANQIEVANNKYKSQKNTFVTIDVMSNSFEDYLYDYLEKIDSLGFDLIHISEVILHLEEPVKLLNILKRYLKKNGYLFIQDDDDGANLVYPSTSFYDLAFKIWADSKESGDRHCARKIPSYLREAGYSKVKLHKCGINNSSISKDQYDDFWDIYFNYNIWGALDENLFYNLDNTMLLVDEYKSLYDENKQKYDNGAVFIRKHR